MLAAISALYAWQAKALAQRVADDTAPIELRVTAADRAAAEVAPFRYHLTPARTRAGAALTPAKLNGPETIARNHAEAHAATVPQRLKIVPNPGFYPADLAFLGVALGKSTVASTTMQNVYVGCSDGTCWGDPLGFEQDLVKSKFLHLIDQYLGTTARNRYSVGNEIVPGPVASNCSTATFCSQDDINGIAMAASTMGGTGKGHLYHIFLPSGVDTCMSGNQDCYAPDARFPFTFCGYHGVLGSGPTATYFTVEPYQDVAGCAVSTTGPHLPNGKKADSTDSVLSHEIFETLTDPDPGFGWVAIKSLNELGFEIGDECQGPPDGTLQFGAIVPIIAINGHDYMVQLEYSNRYHACASAP
jgi:hypothetical protein